MSVATVAKRYKTINLDGSRLFAILRSLAGRESWLQLQIENGTANGEAPEHLEYFDQQLADLRAARLALNAAPFVEG